MVKAEQKSKRVVRFFIEYILVSAPLSIIGSCSGSIIYNKWKFGQINVQHLYRAGHVV